MPWAGVKLPWQVIRCVFLGDHGVGKSSLICRFFEDAFTGLCFLLFRCTLTALLSYHIDDGLQANAPDFRWRIVRHNNKLIKLQGCEPL
jgi:hypothetical protein